MKKSKKKNIAAKKAPKVTKGGPSGLVISLIVHAVAFFVAGLFVVFTVLPKPPPVWTAPPPVERPKMKLKKPKVKIKKSSQPKPSSRIVAKVKTAKMPEIQIPDLVGTGEGILGGLGAGGDFMDMPDIGEASLFGKGMSMGNDFEGRVYHLKYKRDGGPASMDSDAFIAAHVKYIESGWDDTVLEKYLQLPKKLYSTYFAVPPMPSTLCTDAFGGRDLESYWIFAVYKGRLVYKEDIRFRFWGVGDAYIFVNVDGKEVLLNTWKWLRKRGHNWLRSDAPDNLSYPLGNQNMAVGEWIELKANEPVEMKVLFGEWQGGIMSGMLLVEVEGEEYPKSHWNGPLLPLFKTEELTWDDLTQIYKYLPEDECSLTNGPVFNDFASTGKRRPDPYTVDEDPADSPAEEKAVQREWKLSDGRLLEGSFGGNLFDKIVLEDEQGRRLKIDLDQFCEEDQTFLRLQMPPKLKIEFAPLSRQRSLPATYSASQPISSIMYSFAVDIHQESAKNNPYGFPLTLEYFAIGQEVGGETRVVLHREKVEFVLSEENDYSFSCRSPESELLDYTANDERRGTRYDGHLVVVRDINGRIIAHKTTSKGLFRNLDNLSRLRKGWYFDDDCRRALPTPPRPWLQRDQDTHRRL